MHTYAHQHKIAKKMIRFKPSHKELWDSNNIDCGVNCEIIKVMQLGNGQQKT